MKKFLLFLIPLFFILSTFYFLLSFARADELDTVTQQLSQEQQKLSDLEALKNSLAQQIASNSSSLAAISAQLSQAEADLAAISAQLDQKQALLSKWENQRNLLIRQAYEIKVTTTPLEVVLGSDDFATATRNLQIFEKGLDNLLGRITSLVGEINVFEANKAKAEQLRNDLASLKSQYQARLASSQQQFSSTSNQISEVQYSIQTLTARQQELIIAKIGNSLATGSLALADDPNAQSTFNPGFSPAFAGFSFGAYTHRNGMSQYGALGRANSGQTAEQILGAYYPGATLNKSYQEPAMITVSGTNDYGQTFGSDWVNHDFEDYIKHLYEVPTSWPMAVLEAQAVAARSFAILHGSPICPSQSCQEVKLEINSTAWQQAVDATRGWVLTGGSGSFQYSSTAGGYLNTSGWDTTSGNISSWPDNAFENIGGSPWFYKGWYKTLSGATCGRSNPWLTEDEFADILNAWVVYTKGTSDDKSRVTSWDTGCWGGNPYSISEMKSRAEALGGAYTTVSGVNTNHSSDGYTSLVLLVTDRGAFTIDGPTFRDIFNLRAPGYLALKTPLYNIAKK